MPGIGFVLAHTVPALLFQLRLAPTTGQSTAPVMNHGRGRAGSLWMGGATNSQQR